MSIHLSQREIRKGYKGVKRLAQKYFAEGKTWQSLVFVKHCAVLAQQFNWIYADDELEDLLGRIGSRVVEEKVDSFTSIPGRVVFYDDFCTSFVLALQYMRALVAQNKEVLYITSKNVSQKTKFDTIVDEVGSYPGVTVKYLHEENAFDRIRSLYRLIIDFHPEKLLLHMKAFTYQLPVFYVLPSGIERYIINLADQTFWLGKKAIDYSLEFRPFGASISLQRRGLKPEQLLMVPFYPIIDDNPFAGFPQQCTLDKVIIFSGGDLYKVIDKKRMYWKLVKGLLEKYPNTVFLFASKINHKASTIVNDFIRSNKYEDRFFYIDYRKDISEVFKHCDIFMGTCPASGSLMSQLAAYHAKPILQYYYPNTPDDETEQAICINEKFAISHYDEESFYEEAEKLISDRDYRRMKGEILKSAMTQLGQFNDWVSETLATNKSQLPLCIFQVDNSCLEKRWFYLEETGYVDTLPFLYGILGKTRSLLSVPSVFLKKTVNRLFFRNTVR